MNRWYSPGRWWRQMRNCRPTPAEVVALSSDRITAVMHHPALAQSERESFAHVELLAAAVLMDTAQTSTPVTASIDLRARHGARPDYTKAA